ncbi:hypothetical protein [Pseudoruegeria sp. SHC-113]|uniref:hypothetical protein n=1 Tax=Pseudoruegeria sp. SHC-113 TaxID=2855439 RepID=UPI0021BACB30|nr:hypothetical protein [Pseudoruegeria sp. SHC-113]MCT8162018.1 hypothetical protein [Pseudoruegeria sp. SHC-113]
MRRFPWFVWMIALLLMPHRADAGAWPREEGTRFTSVKYTLADREEIDRPGYLSVYSERGLPHRLTFGYDGGSNLDDYGFSGVLYLRKSLPWRAHWFGFELGVGLKGEYDEYGQLHTEPIVRPGLSWGRGLSFRGLNGWAGLESFAEVWVDSQETAVKLDGTLGFSSARGDLFILQLQSGQYPGSDPYLRLAPSYVRAVGPVQLELGLQQELTGQTRTGLVFGIWTEF